MSKQESIPSNYIPKYFNFSSLLMEYQHRYLLENTQKHKEVISNVICYFISVRATFDVQLTRDFVLVMCRYLCHANFIWLGVCMIVLREVKLNSAVNRLKSTLKMDLFFSYSRSLLRHKRDRIFGVVITEEHNFRVTSKGLIGATEYLTLYTGCRIKQCRYNRGV